MDTLTTARQTLAACTAARQAARTGSAVAALLATAEESARADLADREAQLFAEVAAR